MICGAVLPGSFGFAGKKLSGSLTVYASYSIYGGSGVMGTDSLTGSDVIDGALGFSAECVLKAVFSEIMIDSVCVLVPLSAMVQDAASFVFPEPFCLEGVSLLPSPAYAGSGGLCILSGTLGDYGFMGQSPVSVPFGLSDLSGLVSVPLPTVTGGFASDTLRVTADGKDVTDRLVSGSLSVISSSGIPSCTAKFLKQGDFNPAEVVFTINGSDFVFSTVSVTDNGNYLTYKGKTAVSDETYSVRIKGVRASEACAAYTDRIIWAAADFVVGFLYGDFTAFELASELAGAAGLMARLLPSGYILVAGGGAETEIAPAHIFSMETSSDEPDYKTVTVIYGCNDHTLKADDTSVDADSAAYINLYGGLDREAYTENGSPLLVSSGTDTFTEYVFFTDGEGTLSKPALAVSAEGIIFYGRSVYRDGFTGYMKISYTARRRRYSLTGEGKRSVRAEALNTAVYDSGYGTKTKSVKQRRLCDRVTAERLAKKTAGGANTATLVTSHTDIYSIASSLRIKAGGIKGRVTSAVINLSSSPLKITDTLEAEYD